MKELTEEQTRPMENKKVAEINSNISIIPLNISAINTPVKRQKLSDWI